MLLEAARALDRKDLEEESLACARRAARPRGEETSLIEPGLCHGAAGLGQIFNRLTQKTGDPSAREAALYWLGRTLEMRKPGTGAGGFQSGDFDANGQVTWVDDPGFLTGSAGIGLTLLAAIDSTEPEWDRVLLLS